MGKPHILFHNKVHILIEFGPHGYICLCGVVVGSTPKFTEEDATCRLCVQLEGEI